VSVGRSVGVFFIWVCGVQMFSSGTLSWSSFSTYPACINHVLRTTITEFGVVFPLFSMILY